MSSGSLIAFRNDRLGARLTSLVNALRVGQRFGLPVHTYWPKTDEVGAEFNDPTIIFSEAFVRETFLSDKSWRARRKQCRSVGQVRDGQQLVDYVQTGGDVLFGSAFGLTVFDDEDETAVRQQCGAILRSIPLASNLEPIVTRCRETLGNAVAYHIRRGDLVSDIRAMNRRWPRKYVPDAYYMAHMAKALQNGSKIIVFTDEDEVLAKFRAAFPQVLQMSDVAPIADLARGARDFVELVAMSCCQKVVAPELSAFSSAASELGGIQKINVKEDLTKEEKRQVGDALQAAFQTNPDSLGAVGELGQIILHLSDYLVSESRVEEAVKVYRQVTVDAPLPISFLYSEAFRVFFEAEDRTAGMALASRLDPKQIYHRVDVVRSALFRADIMASQGDLGQAVNALRLIMAIDHDAGEIQRVVPLLSDAGILDSANFFPTTTAALTLTGKSIANMSAVETSVVRTLMTLTGRSSDAQRVLHAPLVWDWKPLMNGPGAKTAFKQEIAGKLSDQLQQLADLPRTDPDLRSLAAMSRAYAGEAVEAVVTLKDLARAHPGVAMIHHRLSHSALLAREWKTSIEAARAAVKCDAQPAHFAFLALCLERQKGGEQEGRDAAAAAVAANWDYPPFLAVLSQAELRCGNIEAAREAISKARAILPQQGRYALSFASLSVSLGDKAASLSALKELYLMRKLPKSSHALLHAQLVEAGDLELARSVLKDEAELEKSTLEAED